MQQICDDLEAEQRSIDDMVSSLTAQQWETPTASPDWAVRDQISHLAYFDERGHAAIVDPDAFRAYLDTVLADIEGFMAAPQIRGRAMAPADLLSWWRTARSEAGEVLRTLDPRDRLPWYGPDMGARSFATARLMETWAHGQDVADALGVEHPAADRLKHICHLGVRTRGFSYVVRELEVPDTDVRLEVTAPSGDTWEWGEEVAVDRITGPAEDFCLVVTQRRNVADTALVAEGPLATEWMSIAQAFAGGATDGPAPRTG